MALLQLWHRSQLQHRFIPWPGNFHMLQMQPERKKKKKRQPGVPIAARTWLVSMRMQVWSLSLLSGLWSGIAVSCSIGHRHSLDPTFLWLWCRLSVLTLIWPFDWELTIPQEKKKKKKRTRQPTEWDKILTDHVFYESSIQNI